MLGSLSLHRMVSGTETLGMTLALLVNVPCVVYGYFSHTFTEDTDITSIGIPPDTESAYLYYNKFGDHPSGIPVNFFNGFTNLGLIDLSGNNLDENDLPGGVFNGIGDTLGSLDLGYNSLTVIRKDLLTGLSTMYWLTLWNNQIATIELGKRLE